jgi:hypothetical protein
MLVISDKLSSKIRPTTSVVGGSDPNDPSLDVRLEF